MHGFGEVAATISFLAINKLNGFIDILSKIGMFDYILIAFVAIKDRSGAYFEVFISFFYLTDYVLQVHF